MSSASVLSPLNSVNSCAAEPQHSVHCESLRSRGRRSNALRTPVFSLCFESDKRGVWKVGFVALRDGPKATLNGWGEEGL